MPVRTESSDGFKCEFNHALMKFYTGKDKHCFMLLCPRCDQEVIQQMEKEEAAKDALAD